MFLLPFVLRKIQSGWSNISDHSAHRTVVKNHGRVEILQGDKWQAVCEDTLPPRTAHVICRALGYKEARDEGARLSLKNTLPVTQLEPSPVHIHKQCTGYEWRLKQCNETDADTSDCPENREAFLSCSHNATVYPGPFRLTEYTSNPDPFDTTNTGTGRLNYYNIGKPACIESFSNNDAIVACRSLGLSEGSYTRINSNTPKPKIVLRWQCSGSENSLVSCPIAVLVENCVQPWDVLLKCNPKIIPHSTNLRLTDRHSTDKFRADVSSTGVGRMEVTYTGNSTTFVSFCPENIQNDTAMLACRELGFDNGRLSYLTAEPLPPVSDLDEGGRGGTVRCESDTLSFEACPRESSGHFDSCDQYLTNVVLFCTNHTTESPQIQISPKPCFQSNQLLSDTIFFSGSVDIMNDCEISYCPVKLWNINDAKLSDTFRKQCNNTQQLDITTRENWLIAWNARCEHSADHCSCHLPHEQLFGFASKDTQHNEAFLISRQNHPYNDTLNANGLVVVSKLFFNQTPQVLSPADENLITKTLPVNHIITEQHLLGLYPTENNTSVQLFWSSLEHNNGKYHAKTFNVNGKPLLLTNDSIIVKDTNNSIIQYQLNLTINDNVSEFSINNVPSQKITLPDNAANIFAATLKNEWLYLAATYSDEMDKIYIIRYNITTNPWSYEQNQVHNITLHNITNNNMVINYHNQIQFFPHGQIASNHPVLISIPESGGCASFSEVTETTVINLMIPKITPKTSDDVQSDNKLHLAAGITAVASCIASTVGCICGCCLDKIKNHVFTRQKKYNNSIQQTTNETLNSNIKEQNDETFNHHFVTYKKQCPDDEEEHIYDTID